MTAPTTIDGAMMTDDRMKPGHCHKCGLPLTDNPHPEAGKPPHYLQVGCPKECIPCLTLSRHQWAGRAMKAESELADARAMLAASPATPAQSGEPRGTLAGYFLNCAADDVKPHYLPVGDEHKDNEDVVALYFAPHAPGCGDGEDCDACNAMNAAPPPSQPVEAGETLTDEQMLDAIKSACNFDGAGVERWRTEALIVGRAVERATLAKPSAVVLDDERAAFDKALRETWQMVDPLHPPLAGSYALGEHNGIIAALRTIRDNFSRAAPPQSPDGRPIDKAMLKRLATQWGLLAEQTLTGEQITALHVAADALIERYAAPIREILKNATQPASGGDHG